VRLIINLKIINFIMSNRHSSNPRGGGGPLGRMASEGGAHRAPHDMNKKRKLSEYREHGDMQTEIEGVQRAKHRRLNEEEAKRNIGERKVSPNNN
jgi:hypothetical protein